MDRFTWLPPTYGYPGPEDLKFGVCEMTNDGDTNFRVISISTGTEDESKGHALAQSIVDCLNEHWEEK